MTPSSCGQTAHAVSGAQRQVMAISARGKRWHGTLLLAGFQSHLGHKQLVCCNGSYSLHASCCSCTSGKMLGRRNVGANSGCLLAVSAATFLANLHSPAEFICDVKNGGEPDPHGILARP